MPHPPAATIASEAVRAGAPALSCSLRFRRPRGPMCGRGYCAQCEITTAAGRVLACQAPAGDEPAPQPGRLRLLGRAAEHATPWFYERRLLRPRRLRGPALHALRFLTAAGPLAGSADDGRVRAYQELEAELVFVGSGPPPAGALVVDPERGDVVLGVYPERTLGFLRDRRMLALRFERLILATGSYERLPPIPGSDLPGVLGIAAAERYGAAGALRPGLRVAGWGPRDQHARIQAVATRHRLSLEWLGDVAPSAIEGRRRVEGIAADRGTRCELFLVAVRQPAIELALQAGATARLTSDGLPILALADAPPWLDVAGEAALATSGVPDVPPAPSAIVCPCEDIRVADLHACVAQGFAHPELVKRRTGAMTGPCQGKLCSASVLAVLRDRGVQATPTRARPPARPVSLAELAADA